MTQKSLKNNRLKKDIHIPKVTDIALVAVPSEEEDAKDWDALLLNLRKEPITNVLIASKGYGNAEGKDVQTSTLRKFFERIEANEFVSLEIIRPNLLSMANEFWVSFYSNGEIYDKKFVFVESSISKEHLTTIPVLNKKGVMIL